MTPYWSKWEASLNSIAAVIVRYNWVANTVYESIVKKGKWAWDLFLNNDPNCINCGDCPQPWVKRETCAADLRAYGVNESSPMISRALLYGFSPGSCHGVNTQVRAVMHRIPGSCKPF